MASLSIFTEMAGVLAPGATSVIGQEGRVVISNLSRGSAEAGAQHSLGLKYVAAGLEIYRYGGRTYPVPAGHFLLVPERHGGEVEIGRSDSSTALGLCICLPRTADAAPLPGPLDAPMIFPAACSEVGRLMAATVSEMARNRTRRPLMAEALLARISADVEPLLEESLRIIDGIDALKPSTRLETFRRLTVARGYLHAVTDRAVELAELAKVAGISRFQLLRNFRDAFGAPPAAYHRTLRLQLAKADLDRRLATCSEAAQRYGFADCSSFSHAYRRTFGEAPIRSLKPRR